MKLKNSLNLVKLIFTSDDPNANYVTKYDKSFGRCYSGVKKQPLYEKLFSYKYYFLISNGPEAVPTFSFVLKKKI